jgi:hypothetical protein
LVRIIVAWMDGGNPPGDNGAIQPPKERRRNVGIVGETVGRRGPGVSVHEQGESKPDSAGAKMGPGCEAAKSRFPSGKTEKKSKGEDEQREKQRRLVGDWPLAAKSRFPSGKTEKKSKGKNKRNEKSKDGWWELRALGGPLIAIKLR